MQTTDLPFLIVYGGWISLGAAGVVALLSIWGVLRHRRRRAARRTRTFLDEIGQATPLGNFSNGAQAVVEGAIEFAEGVQLSGSLRAVPARDRQAFVDISSSSLRGSDHWELVGPAELAWGSELNLTEDKTELQMRLRSGDSVRIRGTLEAVSRSADGSKEEVQGYRDASVRWKLVGTDARPLCIVSRVAPRPNVSKKRALGAAVVGLVIYALAGGLIGESLGRNTRPTELRAAGDTVYYPLAAQLLTILPLHREEALRHLAYDLGSLDSLPARRAQVAVLQLQGECAAAVEGALNLGYWDEAAKLLRSCAPEDRGRMAYKVHLNRGEFQQASIALDMHWPRPLRWEDVARVHILAGRFEAAATLMDGEAKARTRMLALPASERPEHAPTDSALKSEEQRLTCLAAATWQAAGRPITAEELEGAPPACKLLRANLLHGSRHETASLVARPPHDLWHFLLAVAADPEATRDQYTSFGPLRYSVADANSLIHARPLGHLNLDLGLLANAYKALSGQEHQRMLRGRLGLELAYWRHMFGQTELAFEIAKSARADLLQASSPATRKLLTLGTAEEQRALRAEVRSQDHGYEQVLYLQLAESLLAGLASRRGDYEQVHQHIEAIKSFTDGALLEFIDIPALMGGKATKWPTFAARQSVAQARVKQASGAHPSPIHLSLGVKDLIDCRGRIHHLEAPQWQVELDTALANWSDALFDPERSLILLLLDE